jgi:hypothetical protein
LCFSDVLLSGSMMDWLYSTGQEDWEP